MACDYKLLISDIGRLPRWILPRRLISLSGNGRLVIKMGAKIAIVINSGLDQRAKVMSALHVAKRIHEARKENGLESVEIFLFTGGVRALEKGQDNSEVIDAMNELREAGITLEACSNKVKNWGLEDVFQKQGIDLEFARDAFSRYAVEGYTVISF